MERQNDGQMGISSYVAEHCKPTAGIPITQAANTGLLTGAVLGGTCAEGRDPVTSTSVYTSAHSEWPLYDSDEVQGHC